MSMLFKVPGGQPSCTKPVSVEAFAYCVEPAKRKPAAGILWLAAPLTQVIPEMSAIVLRAGFNEPLESKRKVPPEPNWRNSVEFGAVASNSLRAADTRYSQVFGEVLRKKKFRSCAAPWES